MSHTDSPPAPMKWTRVARGWQATTDGRYAAMQDGASRAFTVGDDAYEPDGEWTMVFDPTGQVGTDGEAGQNMDSYPTMRQAKAAAQRHADRMTVAR